MCGLEDDPRFCAKREIGTQMDINKKLTSTLIIAIISELQETKVKQSQAYGK